MEFRFDSTGIYESVESNKPDESNRPDESNESSERVMDFYVPRSRTPPPIKNGRWVTWHHLCLKNTKQKNLGSGANEPDESNESSGICDWCLYNTV